MTYPYRSRRPRRAARRPRPPCSGAGIAGLTAAHELAERGFEVTVYERRADERVELGGAAARAVPAGQAGRPGRLAVLDPGPDRRQPRPAASVPRPARASRGRRSGRSPASTASASSPPTTCTSGTCCSASRSTRRAEIEDRPLWQPTSRTVMDNVRRVITQATTVRRQAGAGLPPRAAAQPRRDALGLEPARRVRLHPERRADLLRPDAALPGHQPAAPRGRAAEPLGLRLLRRQGRHRLPAGSSTRRSSRR